MARLEDESRSNDWLNIDYLFPDEQVLAAFIDLISWFVDFTDYLVSDIMLEGFTFH